MYHGTPAERAELRRTVMSLDLFNKPTERKTATKSKSQKKQAKNPAQRTKWKTKSGQKETRSQKKRISKRFSSEDQEDEEESEKEVIVIDSDDEEEQVDDIAESNAARFPVVITTYEMIIKDRVHLSAYDFSYIGSSRYFLLSSSLTYCVLVVVDEGHRLKNMDCRLMQEIKKYRSAGRMILTGTPLHVRDPFVLVVEELCSF
jgi:ATP-dependent DNA helicase